MDTNSNSSNNYTLIIRILSDGFNFGIYDQNHKIISTKMLNCDIWNYSQAQIQDLLCNVEELKVHYRKVSITIESDIYTVVPDSFFDTSNAESFLRMQHPELKENAALLFNNLLAWQAVIIFAIPLNICNIFKQIIPDVEIEHFLTCFINDNILKSKKTTVNVFVRAQQVDFVVVKQGILTLLNSFEYKTNEDIIYFILKVYDSLSLQPENDNLLIFSEKSIKDLNDFLSEYFDNYKIITL
ncbi:MAG: DUF3822 family protein [Paludibacter sp.]|jgi:hypothetical protein|nr:DUF3822 family protein [Paludibacter sp.]